jgi:putative drug exporter of the RND superfamily
VHRLFIGIGQFSVRFRWLVVAAWVIITFASVRAFPGLNSISQSANSAFLPSNTPSLQASKLAATFQSTGGASVTLIVARNGGPLTTADQTAIDQVETAIGTVPHVTHVRDLGVSRDGAARQASIQTNVSRSNIGPESTQLVDDIRAKLSTSSAQSGLEMHLTGSLAQAVDNNATARSSQRNTTNYTIIFIIVLLLAIFRAPLAPLITLIPAGLVLALSGPVITGAANRLNVSVSSITQVILIVLVLGAGTDYALFLIYRVREELWRGLSPHDAVVKAVSTVGETITFSAFTVIAALLSLVLAQFGLYQSLGPSLAIGIFLMLLAGLTMLPALLAIFGRAVFWPISTSQKATQPVGIWGRLSGGLMQRPIVTLAIGVVFFGGLALSVINSPITGFSDQSGGPAGADSTAGTTLIAKHYPSSTGNLTEAIFRYDQPIWNNLSELATAQQQLGNIAAVRIVLGPLTPNGIPLTATQLGELHQALGAPQSLPSVEPAALQGKLPVQVYNAYRGTAQYISPDSQTVAFITVLKDSGGGPAELNAVPALRDAVNHAAQASGAVQNGVNGLNEFAYDVNQISTNDLIRIIPIVALLIALLLAVVMRSLIAPLYLVVSVVVSYLAALGLVTLVFVRLGGQSGVNFVLPFLMFVFLMALGSDYNILVMTRIREEAHTKPLRVAVRDAVSITGNTVTTAGTILAGTFGVLGFAAGTGAGSQQIDQIAFGIAAGVLMDTFLVRTLLVPSMVILLGKWNWWPSPLFKQSAQITDQAPPESAGTPPTPPVLVPSE